MTEHEFLSNIAASKKIIHKVCNVYCEQYSREDLLQDIYYEAWRSIRVWNKACKFSTWIYNISKNVCINHLRKQKPVVVGLGEYIDAIAYEPNTHELLRQIREAMCYESVMDTLDECDKCIFMMYLDGVAYNEIQAKTGIPENTLRTRISRIKKRLRLRYGR